MKIVHHGLSALPSSVRDPNRDPVLIWGFAMHIEDKICGKESCIAGPARVEVDLVGIKEEFLGLESYLRVPLNLQYS